MKKLHFGAMVADESDITYLAREWEQMLSQMEYPRFAFAMRCLHSLCGSFMRGKGLKFGNYQSMIKNLPAAAVFSTTIVLRVSNDKAKEIWFPTLCRLGFDDYVGAADKVTEVLETMMRSQGE